MKPTRLRRAAPVLVCIAILLTAVFVSSALATRRWRSRPPRRLQAGIRLNVQARSPAPVAPTGPTIINHISMNSGSSEGCGKKYDCQKSDGKAASGGHENSSANVSSGSPGGDSATAQQSAEMAALLERARSTFSNLDPAIITQHLKQRELEKQLLDHSSLRSPFNLHAAGVSMGGAAMGGFVGGAMGHYAAGSPMDSSYGIGASGYYQGAGLGGAHPPHLPSYPAASDRLYNPQLGHPQPPSAGVYLGLGAREAHHAGYGAPVSGQQRMHPADYEIGGAAAVGGQFGFQGHYENHPHQAYNLASNKGAHPPGQPQHGFDAGFHGAATGGGQVDFQGYYDGQRNDNNRWQGAAVGGADLSGHGEFNKQLGVGFSVDANREAQFSAQSQKGFDASVHGGADWNGQGGFQGQYNGQQQGNSQISGHVGAGVGAGFIGAVHGGASASGHGGGHVNVGGGAHLSGQGQKGFDAKAHGGGSWNGQGGFQGQYNGQQQGNSRASGHGGAQVGGGFKGAVQGGAKASGHGGGHVNVGGGTHLSGQGQKGFDAKAHGGGSWNGQGSFQGQYNGQQQGNSRASGQGGAQVGGGFNGAVQGGAKASGNGGGHVNVGGGARLSGLVQGGAAGGYANSAQQGQAHGSFGGGVSESQDFSVGGNFKYSLNGSFEIDDD